MKLTFSEILFILSFALLGTLIFWEMIPEESKKFWRYLREQKKSERRMKNES